jgi:tetratricopeptide (TPR) repeat protein
LEGDLAVKLKDTAGAEKHYLAFLAAKPSKTAAGDTYEALADLCVDQQRIKETEAYLTKALAAEDTPARRVFHATSLLRLHRWDAAYAEMDKANKADATDAQVKEWKPQFELLSDFLPDIKAVEAQLATKPNDVDLLLKRAHLFTQANRPILALDDCQRAMKLDPASMCARIQTGEALLDQNRDEEAAKLQVGRNLARDSNKHVRESVLDGLAEKDDAIARDPNNAQALAERAEILRGVNQCVLALSDAQAALAIDEDSAAATYEAAANLRALERPKEALEQAKRATELAPKNSEAWFLRGNLEADRAEYSAAIESITHSLELSESVDSLKVRENCERRINLTDKAEADSKRIHELDPNNE